MTEKNKSDKFTMDDKIALELVRTTTSNKTPTLRVLMLMHFQSCIRTQDLVSSLKKSNSSYQNTPWVLKMS